MFDFRKAFDLVHHESLILKLETCGITGPLLQWIREWLSGRRQKVVLNGTASDWASVLSGVPQGTVLGPLLFLVYINDLPEGLKALLSLFADDLKIFAEVSDKLDNIDLQDDIKKLENWSEKWHMSFNTSKCTVMHLGHDNPKKQYTLNGEALKESSVERDLGVLVQEDLKTHDHCKKVVAKCNQLIGQIRRSFTCKESDLMLKIYKIYLLPHLEYASSVWNPTNKSDINMIESIQRRFTKLIEGLYDFEYEERLTVLELPPLEDRRNYLDLLEVFRIKNEIDHIDHALFHEVPKPLMETRTALKGNLIEEKSKLKVRRDFFTVRAVSEWNKLPVEIQKTKSLVKFKAVTKSFLFN